MCRVGSLLQGTNIPLLYPQLNYTVPSRDNRFEFIDWGAITVNAFEAALVRAFSTLGPRVVAVFNRS